MLCCCHVPMKPGCSALGGLVLNCMELSPAPSALLLTMLMSPRPLLLLLVLLLLWLLEEMLLQTPTMAVGPLALAGGGLGGSGSVLGSSGTVSHSLLLTSNSASLDLDRERKRQGGRVGGMWECEGGEKKKSGKVGSFGVLPFFCLVRVLLLEQEDNSKRGVEGVDVCEVSWQSW